MARASTQERQNSKGKKLLRLAMLAHKLVLSWMLTAKSSFWQSKFQDPRMEKNQRQASFRQLTHPCLTSHIDHGSLRNNNVRVLRVDGVIMYDRR